MKYLLKYWWLTFLIPIMLGAFIFFHFPTGINATTIIVFVVWCAIVVTALFGSYYGHKSGANWWAKTKFWGQLLFIIIYIIYLFILILLLMFALASIK
jgi:hypothetical protein